MAGKHAAVNYLCFILTISGELIYNSEITTEYCLKRKFANFEIFNWGEQLVSIL